MSEISLTSASKIDSIQNFLSSFKRSGEFVYVEQIDKMPAKNARYVVIDFNDIITESNEGGLLYVGADKELVNDPFVVLKNFSKAVFSILEQRFPDYAELIKNKINVRLTNFAISKQIRQINAESYGKLVRITGIVTKSMFPETTPVIIALFCPDGHVTLVEKENDFSGGMTVPSKCTYEKCAQ